MLTELSAAAREAIAFLEYDDIHEAYHVLQKEIRRRSAMYKPIGKAASDEEIAFTVLHLANECAIEPNVFRKADLIRRVSSKDRTTAERVFKVLEEVDIFRKLSPPNQSPGRPRLVYWIVQADQEPPIQTIQDYVFPPEDIPNLEDFNTDPGPD